MPSVNIHEAKTHFPKLVDAAIADEEIIIAKAGKSVVRLIPLEAVEPAGVRFDLLKGEIEIAEDFDAPLPDDLQRAFEGEL